MNNNQNVLPKKVWTLHGKKKLIKLKKKKVF